MKGTNKQPLKQLSSQKWVAGTKVRVVNYRQGYTTYQGWAEKHGLRLYGAYSAVRDGLEGEVMCSGPHCTMPRYGTIYGVRVGNRDIIIGESGLEAVPYEATQP
jgi:hypothetical protein